MAKNKPRYCKVCGRRLAELNTEDACYCHQEGMIVKEHHPATGCTSYAPQQAELDPEDVLPQPGEERYNETAFDITIVGVLLGNGKIYLL